MDWTDKKCRFEVPQNEANDDAAVTVSGRAFHLEASTVSAAEKRGHWTASVGRCLAGTAMEAAQLASASSTTHICCCITVVSSIEDMITVLDISQSQ